ncbi:DUF4169 family protein [Rhodospirillaceae bacterium SYSU D60014]|jgi:hypothetical protein|uniref:DUF4169 family protein n=1 Tax=Virgifigura deserti TaxID=2268457 RepID=UPI000E664ADD
MGEVVNLNKYRKGRQRLKDEKLAAENRVKFGRSKADLNQTQAEIERASKELDDKRRE